MESFWLVFMSMHVNAIKPDAAFWAILGHTNNKVFQHTGVNVLRVE